METKDIFTQISIQKIV